MIKDDYADKLPEFVVSSQELQRVPLALLAGANDVVPVCTRMNLLEKKMEEMVDNMNKFTKGQIFSAVNQVPAVVVGNDQSTSSYANALIGAVGGIIPSAPPLTPSRGRVGSFGGLLAAQKRKQKNM